MNGRSLSTECGCAWSGQTGVSKTQLLTRFTIFAKRVVTHGITNSRHGGAICQCMNPIAQTYCGKCLNTIHNSIGILKTISLTSGRYVFAQDAGEIISMLLVIGYVLFMTLCFAVILFVVAEALNAIEELMDDDDQ